MPFQFPKDPNDLIALCLQAQNFWTRRDERMNQDQDLWELKGLEASEDEIPASINDGRAIALKSASMLASADPVVRAITRKMADDQMANALEWFCKWLDCEFDYEYTAGIHNALAYDEALYALLRGWLCARLMLDPTRGDFPWKYELLDPITIYPRLGGSGKPIFIAHVYKALVSDLKGEWGEDAYKLLQDRDDKETVWVYGLYTDQQYAIVADSDWLKKPTTHGYGFNPILCMTANGAPYRSTDHNQNDWVEHVGIGILTSIRSIIEQKEEGLTMLRTLLTKEAAPPVVLRTDNERISADVDTKINGMTIIGQKDSLDFLHIGPNMQDFMPYMQQLQDMVFAASLGPATFQDKPYASGFDRVVAEGTAKDILFPYVKMLEKFYALRYRCCLQLFGQFGAQPVSYPSTDQATGRQTIDMELDPAQVAALDIRIEVRYRDVTPQDKHANAQTAALLAREKLLSLDTVRDLYLQVGDTQLENTRVLADLIFMNPQVVQMASLAAAAQSSDPLVRQMAQQQMQQMQMQLMMQQQKAMMGAPGEAPGNTQPPPPGVGMPSQVSPDEQAGPNAGLGPNGRGMGPPASGPNPPLQLPS